MTADGSTRTLADIGVVAIGRNEGARLVTCLHSLLAAGADPDAVVYVDSGSTDGSAAAARVVGVRVVELDLSIPFTAARARNTGLHALHAARPQTRFVQFIDGDCEMAAAWMRVARSVLTTREEVAAVAGRCRERFPDRTIYNRLCEIEWNTPAGEVASVGGISMMRVAPFLEVGGFNASIIAGEEPELCVRLRKRGGKILRLADEMVLHDAAMTHFRQWWKRMKRAGHAYAEIAAIHGKSAERFWVKEHRSNWFWGAGVPFLTAVLIVPTRGWSGLLIGAYLLLWMKIHGGALRQGLCAADARLYASFTTLSKFPAALGQARYWIGRCLGRRSRIIEYKATPSMGQPVAGEAAR